MSCLWNKAQGECDVITRQFIPGSSASSSFVHILLDYTVDRHRIACNINFADGIVFIPCDHFSTKCESYVFVVTWLRLLDLKATLQAPCFSAHHGLHLISLSCSASCLWDQSIPKSIWFNSENRITHNGIIRSHTPILHLACNYSWIKCLNVLLSVSVYRYGLSYACCCRD